MLFGVYFCGDGFIIQGSRVGTFASWWILTLRLYKQIGKHTPVTASLIYNQRFPVTNAVMNGLRALPGHSF